MTEPLDRNKSAATHRATATAAAWLDTLGCKPVETEVPMPNGTIADVASFWSPTLTEARRARLLRDLVPPPIERDSIEALSRITRHIGGRLTIAVEVKVSRADFLRDLGKKYAKRGERASILYPAHFCVIAAPNGVMVDGEADDWGHLRLSDDCSRVVKWRGPWYANPMHPGHIEDFIAAVAVRRDHQTRYASIRRWLKASRAS